MHTSKSGKSAHDRLGVEGDMVWVNDMLVPVPSPRNPKGRKSS